MDSGGVDSSEEEQLRRRLAELKAKKQGRDETSQAPGRVGFRIPALYVIAIAILIMALAIYLRSGMLQYMGFFEPDGFFHYSVIEQSIANGFSVPLTSMYSGFPTHNAITEPLGFYYATLIPYAFLQYFGISAYTVQRLVPLAFAIGEIIAAYFLVRYLAKSRTLGLLAMLMVALSGGDAARTSALVYRGDGFITLFVMVAFLLLLRAMDSKGRSKYVYMLLSPTVLGLGTAMWNGAPYAIIAYVLVIILLEIYEFIRGNRERLRDAMALGGLLIVTYAIEHLFRALSIIRLEQGVSSLHFFIFYAPMLLGGIVFYMLLKRRRAFGFGLDTAKRRAAFTGMLALLAAVVILSLFYGYLAEIATGQGLVSAGNAFTQTIEELQPPSLQFLWVSFSLELYLAPIGMLAFVLLSRRRSLEGATHGFANEAFLAFFAYFIVTLYLQINAVRYNAVVSVPIALFAAYAIYALGKPLINVKISKLRMVYPYIVVAAAIILVIALIAYAQTNSEVQADGINQDFLNATLWINANTPKNATFLTLWPDGSVIEGFGQRQSYSDSVAGQGNGVTIFPKFLFNTTPDAAYLEGLHPGYLLVRGFWFQESGGIAQEGNIQNMSQFGFTPLQPMQPQSNAAAHTVTYPFTSSSFNVYMVVNSSNGTRIGAYLSYGSGNYVPLDSVLFYNNDNGSYSYSNVTATGADYVLFITYSQQGSTLSIGSSALLSPRLVQSNFFKLIVLCGYTTCPYDNKNITLSTVYANSDTKIFKVNYLNTT